MSNLCISLLMLYAKVIINKIACILPGKILAKRHGVYMNNGLSPTGFVFLMILIRPVWVI